MRLYNNVAELRLFRGASGSPCTKFWKRRSAGGTDHLDLQLADLLAQGVAMDAQEIGGADLVAAGGGERRGDQRIFDLAQDAVIEARRRQRALEIGEIPAEIPLDRDRELVLGNLLRLRRHGRRLRELRIDHRGGDRLLRIERR